MFNLRFHVACDQYYKNYPKFNATDQIQMNILFKYDANDSWIKTNRQQVLVIRLFMLYIMIGGILDIITNCEDGHLFFLITGGLLAVGGAIQIFNPYKKYLPRDLRTEFIYISDKEIVTRDGPLKKVHEYNLDEIESYRLYIGQVHFKTKDGKTFRFSTHKIHDKEKHDELLRLLLELFSTEGSLKSRMV